MKSISVLLYEIEDIAELNNLSDGQKVIQYDKRFGCHHMLTSGEDKFSADTGRYVYLLLEPPKLPATASPS